MGELKTIDMTAKLSNFSVINKDFTRCRCNVFYTGRNRNYSDITKEALQKFIDRKGYANVPVVAHLYKGDDGKLRVGGHDSKIILSEEGIEFINECVPFGVIPEDCNPSMDLITEKSGEQKEYFSVDIILWTHRYPIMDAAFSEEIYFNQSMEISLETFYEDNDGYTVIDDFTMSALCLLNKSMNREDNVEPAFESSMVKKFSINEEQFKKNFELMLEELKSYDTGNTPVQDKNDTNKEGEINMDLTKFASLISDIKYGDDCVKYSLLTANEENIVVVDREDYKLYSVGYAVSEDNVIINWDTKKEVDITYTDKSEDKEVSAFTSIINDLKTEIEANAKKASDADFEVKIQAISEDAEKKLDEFKANYEDLSKSYAVAKDKLDKFEAVEAERAKETHKAEVNAELAKFEEKIGKSPEFIYYKAKLDVENADVNTVNRDLTLMTGDILMSKKDSKKSFSYTPITSGIREFAADNVSDRYGNLLDNWKN